MLGLDGVYRASFSRIGPRASARSSRLTTIGLSRRFLAGSNAAADNYRIGNARSSFHGGLSRTRVRLPPPPPNFLTTKPNRARIPSFRFRVEIARQHQLECPFVGAAGHANPDARFDIHELAGMIQHGPHLLELLAHRKEVAQRSEIGILLGGNRPFFVDVVGDAS